MKKIDLYYFGDIGDWDDKNPYYWYQQPSSPEILFIIACSGGHGLTISDIAAALGRNPADLHEQISAMTERRCMGPIE